MCLSHSDPTLVCSPRAADYGHAGGNGPKLVDPVRARLGLCAHTIYGVDLQRFIPSAPGQNGSFVAQNSDGSTLTVENDVGSYTKVGLAILALDFGKVITGEGIAGLTLGSNPSVNYTASNLDQAYIPQLNFTNWVIRLIL
jgi:hypothetical protein